MSTARRTRINGFYWIGVTMTLACFAFVMAGNTELLGRFEHRGFPLSWAFAGAAIIAFLAAEACHTPLRMQPRRKIDLRGWLRSWKPSNLKANPADFGAGAPPSRQRFSTLAPHGYRWRATRTRSPKTTSGIIASIP
jgi:hypothetical protein